MIENEHIPVERRWGKPVIRPDGLLVEIHINDEEGFVRFAVGNENVAYTSEEIVFLGSGDFDTGMRRIGVAYYRKKLSSEVFIEDDKIFEGEIIRERALGKLPKVKDILH